MSRPGIEGSPTVNVSTTVTRPDNTTAYTAADLIANSATAGSVTPLTFLRCARDNGPGAFIIRRARLYKDDDDVTNAKFRLHLFDADPTGTAPTNGDNGAIQLTGVLANTLGSIDFDLSSSPDIHTDGNCGVGVPLQGSEICVDLTGTNRTIWGLLEARAAYTPASGEIFTVLLEIIQD